MDQTETHHAKYRLAKPIEDTSSSVIYKTVTNLEWCYESTFKTGDFLTLWNDIFDRFESGGIISIADVIQGYDKTMRINKLPRSEKILVSIKSALINCYCSNVCYLAGNMNLAWFAATTANTYAGVCYGILNQLSFADAGIKAKLAKDPRQADRRFVHECWKAWKTKPSLYATKAEFARDMLNKCEFLVSTKKIEDWCREWDRTEH